MNFKVLSLLLLLVTGMIGCSGSGKKNDGSIEQTAESKQHFDEMVRAINGQCPMRVDEITVLDSVSFHDNIYQYYYTITDRSQFDVPLWESVGIDNVKRWFKEDPNMKDFLKYDVTLRYLYRDENGSKIFGFDITPEDYNN